MFKNTGLFKSSAESNNEKTGAELHEGELEAQKTEKPQNNQIPEQPDEATAKNTAEGENTPSKVIKLSPEELARFQAIRSKMVSASFGEITTMLMRSPHYRHYTLADLEWLVVPPLMTNQFLVVEAQVRPPAPESKKTPDGESPEAKSAENAATTGVRIPVGLALWAKVSPEVDARLSENLDSPIKLRPDEWRSGEINWLIEIFGDEKILPGLYEKLKNDVFKGQTFKVRAQDKEGAKVVKEVSGGDVSVAAENAAQ